MVYLEQLPRIYNFLRYRTGDDLIAEDLTATTFEKAWTSRDKYRSDLSAFSTWLFAIAANLAIDHHRKKRKEIALSDLPGDMSSEQSIEDIVAQKADFARLMLLLEKLSARDRELFALKHGAGLTNQEIAKITGLSESNVGTVIYRVANKLRVEWEITL